MLERIAVRNFQSIHKLDVELEAFTIIVGQSSSGKSAFTRALRTLSGNARGTSFITHGERTCTISATTDLGIVSLTKGSKDEYTVIRAGGTQQAYTKLGGDVPPDVTSVLGIAPKDPINFAGQFDMPYLLRASPSEVARVLGELTNADIVFTAARESNRRRLAASGTLKVKADDLEQITEQARQYERLEAQLAAIGAAEEYLSEATYVNGRIKRLDGLLSSYQDALQRLVEAERAACVVIPDLGEVVEIQRQLDRLYHLLEASALGKRAVVQADEAISSAMGEIEAAEAAYVQALHDLGTCPTCGQDTKELGHG